MLVCAVALAAPPGPSPSPTPASGPHVTLPAPESPVPPGSEPPERLEDSRPRPEPAVSPRPRTPLPRGSDLPSHFGDTIGDVPRIEEFRATDPDCPGDDAPPNFLSYRVANVKAVQVKALLDGGSSRHVFHWEAPEPVPERRDRFEDRNMTPGQLAYELVATGAHGTRATRRIDYRTPGAFNIRFKSAMREVVETRRPFVSHWEAQVDAYPVDRLTRFQIQALDRVGNPTGLVTHGEIHDGVFRSEPTLWDSEADRKRSTVSGVVEFRAVLTWRLDPCPGSGGLDTHVRAEPAI
jgi:hypothetical protein